MIRPVDDLSSEEKQRMRFQLQALSPIDAKYAQDDLVPYLSPEAEWLECAKVQRALLKVRTEMCDLDPSHLAELDAAMSKLDPLNMALIEKLVLRHDQLAVIEEIGNHVSSTTKALLHPGTTSYDILDTARSSMFRRAWRDLIGPEVNRTIDEICETAETFLDVVQAGRTHLQQTAPVTLGSTFAGYAARLRNRYDLTDRAFADLRGKISGIVGTGASIEQVVGPGRSQEFERRVLAELDLQPDTTATQIVQKERLADVGHQLVSMYLVLADLANDMRILYSSEIGEVTTRSNAQRLGGSSADASKDNPINYENTAGKVPLLTSGMNVLYTMIMTDLQRDLRSSVQARYEPFAMMSHVLEGFRRIRRVIGDLSVNTDRVEKNLAGWKQKPAEAMTQIARSHGWTHPEYGVGHSAVKEFAKAARASGEPLLTVALKDSSFREFYDGLPELQRTILSGNPAVYLGHAKLRATENIAYART